MAKPFVESAAQAAHGHGGHNMISSSPRVIHGPGVETLLKKKNIRGHITPYEDSTSSMKKVVLFGWAFSRLAIKTRHDAW